MLLKVAERVHIDSWDKRVTRKKVKLIGLGNALFWLFTGLIIGYLFTAVYLSPIWNQ